MSRNIANVDLRVCPVCGSEMGTAEYYAERDLCERYISCPAGHFSDVLSYGESSVTVMGCMYSYDGADTSAKRRRVRGRIAAAIDEARRYVAALQVAGGAS